MDESTPSTPESANAPAAAPVARSIGERLRTGRDKAGLTTLAAAEKLHLDPKVIEALEADRFAELGASVYVRGHLKRYAEFVGENAIELLNMYAARDRAPARPDLTQVPHPERRADPRRLVTPLVALGSAGALLAAIWWALTGTGSGVSTQVSSETPPRQMVPADGAPVASMTAPGEVTPASLTSSSPMAVPQAAQRAPAPVPAETASRPVEQPRETTPVHETSLRLELTGESWVEVYDSRGERLYYDIADAGSVQSVTGPPPLRVFLGNAAGVTVQVDGQTREIPPGAVDGEGAGFVVNRSGSLARAR